MPSYLITGCSRGLGLELTRQLISTNEDATIFASARSSDGPGLRKLLETYPERIIYVHLDVTDRKSIEEAVEFITAKLDGKGLDVLINNAGFMYPIQSVLDMETEQLEDTFRINVSSVHNLTKAVLPLMRKGEVKKILNMSSSSGSIAKEFDNSTVLVPPYSISKTGLNMLTVAYARELEKEGFTIFSVNPGWVKTDLGSQHADLSVETSISALLDILHRTGKEGNARFLNVYIPGWDKYAGGELPW
ncbi:hypothetical protein BJX99DRAFT_254216 [Aspergillus californicus]